MIFEVEEILGSAAEPLCHPGARSTAATVGCSISGLSAFISGPGFKPLMDANIR
jgi:hypothetical protein